MTTDIGVTVVLCTYNRAEMLRAAIDSLLTLRTDGRFCYEVLVVDNASTDDTGRVIAEAAQRAAVSLRGVKELRAGIASARNCGIRAARGQWIAFFDDDQVAEPDWLLELVNMAESTGTRCVAGAVRLLLPQAALDELPPLCRRLLGESAAIARPRKLDRKLGLGTGNLLIHRTVFEEIGLFDESLHAAGEDTDLYHRIRGAGIEGWFAPSAVVRHVVPPYRLRDDYWRWTSRRNGMHLAHSERQRWGALVFPAVLAARMIQAAGRCVPRWIWAGLTRSRKTWLAGQCQCWRAEGYLRLALLRAMPAWFAQSDFVARVNFRTERELFAPTGAGERQEGVARLS